MCVINFLKTSFHGHLKRVAIAPECISSQSNSKNNLASLHIANCR